MTKVREPPLVVLILLEMIKAVPVKLMPFVVFVSRFPVKVVVPEPAFWIIAAALTDPIDTLFALVMFKLVIRVPPPMAPLKVIFPAPATKKRLAAPSIVLKKLIGLPFEVIVERAVKVTALVN